MSSQSVTRLQGQNNGVAVGLDFGTMHFPELFLTIFQLTLVGGGWPPQIRHQKPGNMNKSTGVRKYTMSMASMDIGLEREAIWFFPNLSFHICKCRQ